MLGGIERQSNMKTEQNPVDYNAVLADLETQRAELDAAIAVVKRMLGQPAASTSPKATNGQHGGALTPTSLFGMNLGDAIKHYLSVVKEPKTAPEIAQALLDHGIKTMSKNFNTTVFSALERREEAGDMVRPKRGLWGLKEWYPGARIPAAKPNSESW